MKKVDEWVKTIDLKIIQIHFYPTDVIELGIAVDKNYILLNLIFICIEIDWQVK